MRVLLSNDDGVHAEGINTLFKVLQQCTDVTMIGPDRNCSGASNSLTLSNPIRAQKIAENIYSVNGTPTDCIHLGINQLLKPEPELVISGINHGANLGDDVIYSGTVAAATEGRYMGHPAIAISLVGQKHFSTAAQVILDILPNLAKLELPDNQILNINVPDLAYADLKGMKITRCGSRHRADSMTKTSDPYGKDIYWYGPQGAENDDSEDTDFYAIKNGFVSITPLTVDMTDYTSIPALSHWLGDF